MHADGQVSQVEARLLLHPGQLLDLAQAAGAAVAARDVPRWQAFGAKVRLVTLAWLRTPA